MDEQNRRHRAASAIIMQASRGCAFADSPAVELFTTIKGMDGSGRQSHWAVVAAFAVVALAYVWTVWSNGDDLKFGSEQHDYYNLLAHGLRDGQLNLKTAVSPSLLTCADPYDPAKRPPGEYLHDASFYRGKYYIYYGVVPAVLLLVPFRIVTGVDLPLPIGVLAFALAGYAASLALLSALRRRYFPQVGSFSAFLVAVAVGFASCLPLLVRRGSMYEFPIVSGSFFALLAIGCLYKASDRPRRMLTWTVGASVAWGLAVGSRPTYVVPACVVLVGFLVWVGRTIPAGRRERLRLWISATIPIGVIGILLAWYNVARFGTPTEFGLRYILSGVYEAKIEHFRLRYVTWNAFAYLFAPVTLGRYFPFLHERPITLTLPTQHFGMDHPFGLMLAVPFLWLAVFGAGNILKNRTQPRLRAVLAGLVILAATMMGVLFGFYAAMARYLGDFAPPLAIVAAVGAFTLVQNAGAGWRSGVRRTAVLSLAFVSCFTVWMFSIQLYGHMRANNPGGYAAVARVLNLPTHWVEARLGRPVGAEVLRLEFPAQPRVGGAEEILRTGFVGETDRVMAAFVDAHHVVFEYEHAGAPSRRSPPILVEPGSTHAVRLTLGSLAPPPTSPAYDTWLAIDVRHVTRHLEIAVDEAVVLDGYQRFYLGGNVVVGGAGAEHPFSGRVLDAKTEPLALTRHRLAQSPEPLREIAPDKTGTWRLQVRFPIGKPGTREPLLVTGETGRGDFIAVEYVTTTSLRFVLDHWGTRLRISDVLAYEPERIYRVDVAHPAFVGSAANDRRRNGELVVRLDGRVVWRAQAEPYGFDRHDVYVGANPLGGSCAEAFGGKIAAATTEHAPR